MAATAPKHETSSFDTMKGGLHDRRTRCMAKQRPLGDHCARSTTGEKITEDLQPSCEGCKRRTELQGMSDIADTCWRQAPTHPFRMARLDGVPESSAIFCTHSCSSHV